MEIKTIQRLWGAIPPWGNQIRLRPRERALSSESRREELGNRRNKVPTTTSYKLAASSPKGDILTLLEKGHFNFAQRGDILTLL